MPEAASYQVDFQPVGKRVDVPAGTTLIDAARQAGITLTSACGGAGSCGQCRIAIMAGEVSAPTANEHFVLGETELGKRHRLACAARVRGTVRVHVPRASLISGPRLQIAGDGGHTLVDPAVVAYRVEIPPPSLHDPRSDLARIAATVAASGGPVEAVAKPSVTAELSRTARACDWHLNVYVRGEEIIGCGPHDAQALGMAVDIGTTKIAAYLIDLDSGAQLATAGMLNPQIAFGEDVVSRLTHCRRADGGARELAASLREALHVLLAEMLKTTRLEHRQVVDLCMVGNTAMIHLLLELPVEQLAVSPYVAATGLAVDIRASELGLTTAPGARVHVLPSIGGYVGADHVAMILASDLDQCGHVALGVDIGTNTEIVLADPGVGFLACASCASGPAFEGAHIGDGMRAAAGAIEAVRLGDNGVELKTIDAAPPVGLCGSGVVDAIAELRRCGLINERGRFERAHALVRDGRRGPEFLLAGAADSGSGRDVALDQQDVNEIQLAKGAIRAGLEALLEATGTAPEDVSEVIIAGAFGSFLNIGSATAIGLFPELPNARYRQVGNAAGAGAKAALVSCRTRERAARIAAAARYIELATFPKFSRLFALGMLFPDNLLPAAESRSGVEGEI